MPVCLLLTALKAVFKYVVNVFGFLNKEFDAFSTKN
jgi:hypothetical protein